LAIGFALAAGDHRVRARNFLAAAGGACLQRTALLVLAMLFTRAVRATTSRGLAAGLGGDTPTAGRRHGIGGLRVGWMEASLPLRHDPARSAHWKFGRTTSLFFVLFF